MLVKMNHELIDQNLVEYAQISTLAKTSEKKMIASMYLDSNLKDQNIGYE